jgi:hypothetical protein
MREEADATFFLWRAIGNATFVFQSDERRLALALYELPEEAIHESVRSAWVLVIVGSLVALTGPLLREGGPPRGKKVKRSLPARAS